MVRMGEDEWEFIVTVIGCTAEQAEEVIAERVGYDEDYGFPYKIEHRKKEEQMICNATTTSQDEVVHCTKAANHVDDEATANHWGLTSKGMDVVWASVTLKKKEA